jgi:hypothetical protein
LIMVTEQASVNGAPAGLIYHGGGIGGQTFTQPFQNTYGRNIDAAATAASRCPTRTSANPRRASRSTRR